MNPTPKKTSSRKDFEPMNLPYSSSLFTAAACLGLALSTAACASKYAPDNHTEAPAGGELVHQPPAPESEIDEGELQAPDPQADIKKGKPPEYYAIMKAWSDPQGHPEMWRTTGVAIDVSVSEACDLDGNEAYFGFDSAELKPGAKDRLGRIVQCYEDGKIPTLQIVGHTDPRGSDQYNKELGMSRAEAVASYLKDNGVPQEALDVNSKGERKANEAEDEWPQDRRVDIRVDADPSTTDPSTTDQD